LPTSTASSFLSAVSTGENEQRLDDLEENGIHADSLSAKRKVGNWAKASVRSAANP
jgi:hypothetical protein